MTIKWTRIATLAAVTAAAVMTLTVTGCGGSSEEASSDEPVVSAVSQAEVQEPESLPFTMPKGFSYNKDYSTAETALYNNSKGIAITFARTESSASYLLSAQNNTASQATTASAIQAGRPDISNLEVTDFSYDSGQGYISYTYTMSFTNHSVEEINYVYTYTNDTDNYAVSVNAAQTQSEDAKAVAKSVIDSFNAK